MVLKAQRYQIRHDAHFHKSLQYISVSEVLEEKEPTHGFTQAFLDLLPRISPQNVNLEETELNYRRLAEFSLKSNSNDLNNR